MKKQLFNVLARTSIGAIAIATAMPTFAHAADDNTAPATLAQDKTPAPAKADDQAKKDTDIVVTGSQIRNVTPAGAPIVTTTAAQAEEQGATNANEILQQIPQASNVFQNLPSVGGGASVGIQAASRLSFSSVTLRNLPNFNTGAGEFTLQLLDGHRIVPIGSDVLGGVGVDASTIPASTLLRTEIMPDGGSAIYGSNAVAGVINYITRDDFDGIQIQARGGIAGSYKQYDASLTAGTKWSTGSVFGSVTYSYHDALFGRDRDWIHAVDADPFSPLYNMPLGLNCVSPNIAITTPVNGVSSRRLYPLTGVNGTIQPYTTNNGSNGNGTSANGIAGGNRCDSTDNNAYYPLSNSVNVMAGLKQEILPGLTFSVKGNWGRRKTTTSSALTLTATENATVANPAGGAALANPNYRPVCNAPAPAPQIAGLQPCTIGGTNGFFLGDNTQPQSILTDFSSVLPTSLNSFITVETWQVTPMLTWDFAKDWQVRALVSYGESNDAGISGSLDSTLVTARIAPTTAIVNGVGVATGGLINPYNLPGSAPGAFDGLIKYDYRAGQFHLLDVRAVADGPLPFIHAPGGDIKVAIGAEYTKTDLRNIITGSTLSTTPGLGTAIIATNLTYTQTVKSVFGEMQVPLVSEAMDIPLIHSLNVSGSARYDYYNDVKGTFNWMAGATWAPISSVKVSGNYNTSFAAPNGLSEIATAAGAVLSNSTNNQAALLPYFVGFVPPGPPNGGSAGNCLTGAGTCFAIANSAGGGLNIGISAVPSNGTVKGIGPQTSRTWSVGADFSFVPGLTFGFSYYDLKISGAIGSPVSPNPQSVFDFHPELITCHGGVKGNAANATTACAVPMSIAELTALGWLTAADPTNPNAVGLSTAASLTNPSGPGGAFGTIAWPTILAQYCGPAGSNSPAGDFGSCHALPNTNGNTYSVFFIEDNRTRNLGFIFSTGLDFHAAYRTRTSWGSIDANVAGTINLSTLTQSAPTAVPLDVQATGVSKWRLSASAGTNWGGLRAQVTWQHSAGYDLTVAATGSLGTAVIPGTGAYGQSHIRAYDTFDLFFRYDFNDLASSSAVFKGLTMTLNVNNFLDIDPPRSGGSFANGTTLGRMWQLGITKSFK